MIEDEAWLRGQIAELTATHEGGRAAPWAVGDAPEDFVAAMARQIVGLEIEIDDLRGKWKASQNRPAADRAGVIAGLTEDGDADGRPRRHRRRAVADRRGDQKARHAGAAAAVPRRRRAVGRLFAALGCLRIAAVKAVATLEEIGDDGGLDDRAVALDNLERWRNGPGAVDAA